MIFQRLNRTDPERVFVIVQNNEGAQINKDQSVQWELASASIDGVKVRDLDTGNLYAFAGVADANIATSAYGLIQVYGYRSTSILFQTGASQDTGLALIPVVAVDYLQSVATVLTSTDNFTRTPIVAVLGESIASAAASATVSRKIFIRAL
jgi:hypothetical protein